jgi:allantoin racemase
LQCLASPGVTVDVHGISPPDRFFHPITEFCRAQQTIHAAVEAQREGCDAVVIGHFQEPGLTECRGAVDIPVIGLGEATMLFGCSIGRRIGLVTIDPVLLYRSRSYRQDWREGSPRRRRRPRRQDTGACRSSPIWHPTLCVG